MKSSEISQNPSTRDYSWFCLQLVCTKHRFDLISFDFHEAYKYSHERFHELFCDANFRAPANATFSAGSSSKLKLTVLKNEFERVRIQILIRAVEIDALPFQRDHILDTRKTRCITFPPPLT
jgi:hypothetical protein